MVPDGVSSGYVQNLYQPPKVLTPGIPKEVWM